MNGNDKINHLALFCPSLEGGGAERAFVNLANSFVKNRMRVDFILVEAKGVFLGDLDPGVKIFNLKKTRAIRAFPSLIKYLNKERPQFLISALDNANIIASAACFFSLVRVKLFLTVHAPPTYSFLNNKTLYGRIFTFLSKLSYLYANTVVGVSKGVCEDIKVRFGLNSGHVVSIYNPLINRQLKKYEKKNRHPWLDDLEVPFILSVGRLSKEKDYQSLIIAFKRVVAKRKIRLIILGEGEERDNLERLIENLKLSKKISLPGFVKNPELYMKKSALFILSSKYEGFGNVLVEALELGCKIISTDCPVGPREILESGKYGRLVPVGDPTVLTKAIISEMEKKTFRKDIHLNKHLSMFETKVVADKYLNLLRGSV